MQISPNMQLAAKYVAGGAAVGAGYGVIKNGVEHIEDSKPLTWVTGGAAVATGLGSYLVARNNFDKLALAEGAHRIPKSLGMIAAAGAAMIAVPVGMGAID